MKNYIMLIGKRKLFKFIIIALMILGVYSLDRCVNHGDTCDLKNGVKCCGEKLTCKQSNSTNLFMCFKEARLEEYCESDEDCDSVRHGQCSTNNKCVCKSNHIRINSKHCAPSLGEQCVGSEYCATENSLCIDNKCQCKNGYFLYSGEQCLPNIIGEHCDDDTACSRIKFASCSEDKICTCSPTTLGLTPALCVPLLDVPCQVNEDCKVDYSSCIENECKCKPNYRAYSYSKCKPMNLGTTCRDDSDCKTFISNSKCSRNKICTCDYNYFQTKDGICKSEHERSCSDDELCDDENSVCVDRKCQCKPQHDIQGSKCVPTALLKSCNADADCHRIQFAVCSRDKKCICKENFVELDDTTCVSKLGKICYTDLQCHIKNSICIHNQCQCELGYLNVADKQCVLIESTERYCYNNNRNCRLFTSTQCQKDGRCVCTEYKVKINSTACDGSLGKFCINNNQCESEYSICLRNQCKCKLEYVSHFNIDCPTPYLGMPCQYDSYCQKFIKNTVCSKNICVCGDMYSSVNNKMCLPKLNVFCAENEQCAVENSACIYNVCQCKSNYVHRGFRCVTQLIDMKKCPSHEDCNEKNLSTQLTLSKSCSTNRDCLHFRNSRCSLNQICVCKQNNFGLINNHCYPINNGICSKDEECGENFHCVNFLCQCKPNFSSISVDQCIPSHQLYYCNDNLDCSDPWHSKCSENKKCVCNLNNIAVSNSTCLPLLDGYCWRDNQCLAGNSICDDFRCRCRPNFVAIADNLCVLKN